MSVLTKEAALQAAINAEEDRLCERMIGDHRDSFENGFDAGYSRGRESARRDNEELAAALREYEEIFRNPPKHKFWGAGEPDCPPDIKARNGELHTLRCKLCDDPKAVFCKGDTEGGIPCESCRPHAYADYIVWGIR